MRLLLQNRKHRQAKQPHISTKANRILHFILIAILLMLARIWHLTVIQYDQKWEESQKPQHKMVIEPSIRASIRDRFNIPLAINKISYQATILYSQLKDIPSFIWEKDETGKRTKVFKRRAYIKQLSQLLAKELELDSDRIEDLIHAKASYYSQIPFIIKDDLTEKEYYHLKILEKEWAGLLLRHSPKRIYPQGRVAADVIGYMGAINRAEYEKILHEKKALEQFVQMKENEENEEIFELVETQDARSRLKELESKAYTIHDYIGKTGIEGVYEKQLRGLYGKKHFYADSKGHFLRELSGSQDPLPGQRILLTLSSELQEYAEMLLVQNEELRAVRKTRLGTSKQTTIATKQPWIKGGAIVAMEPNTGEIIALASYPRFDPNDFISSGDDKKQRKKRMQIHRWFENDSYLSQIWHMQQPLCRERYDIKNQTFYEEQQWLTWHNYLNFILPVEGRLRQEMQKIQTITQAGQIQLEVGKLLTLFPQYDLYTLLNYLYCDAPHEPYHQLKGNDKQKFLLQVQEKKEELKQIKICLDPYFTLLPENYDKVLLVDLCRVAIAEDRFSSQLLLAKGQESIDNYHKQTASLVTLWSAVKEKTKQLFHEIDFKAWRQQEEKLFLKSKRNEEKLAKTYPKPYIDYLDQKENDLFQAFWQDHAWDCLYAFLVGDYPKQINSSIVGDFSHYLTTFKEWRQSIKEEQTDQEDKLKNALTILHHSIKGVPPNLAIDYLKTMRPFEELKRPLLGKYRYLRHASNPLEKDLAAAFYPAYGFGCGRSYAYRQSAIQGSLFKLVTAYEALKQQFQKMGRNILSPLDLNPLVIIDQVYKRGGIQYVGYHEDGKPIPQLYKGGRLPRSLAHQNSGRIDLLGALEVSSNPYFSLLAGECLNDPSDLTDAATLFGYGSRTGINLPGEIAGKVPNDLKTNRTGLYAMAIGQHTLVVTPLQTAVMLATIANGGHVLKPKLVKLTAGHPPYQVESKVVTSDSESLIKEIPTEVKREIFMPEVIRQILLKGLHLVTQRSHRENIGSLSHLYKQYPEAIRQFTELKDQLLGKTSTAESVENLDLDLHEGTNIYTHVWFGSVFFQNTDKNKAVLLYKDEFGQPELIVVVYLRYGGYGKEAAPLAAQVVHKWREIKQKYAQKGC